MKIINTGLKTAVYQALLNIFSARNRRKFAMIKLNLFESLYSKDQEVLRGRKFRNGYWEYGQQLEPQNIADGNFIFLSVAVPDRHPRHGC